MVLLNDIVQVFALTDLDTFLHISTHLFQARVIGPVLINIHQTRFTILANCFLYKA